MDQMPTRDTPPADEDTASSSAEDAIYEPIAEELVDDALARAESDEADKQAGWVRLEDPDADIYEATATKLVDGMLEPHGLEPDDSQPAETNT